MIFYKTSEGARMSIPGATCPRLSIIKNMDLEELLATLVVERSQEALFMLAIDEEGSVPGTWPLDGKP
jgi:hypothetical protein